MTATPVTRYEFVLGLMCASCRELPCICRRDSRCGAWMPQAKERCARTAGHRWDHKTRYSLDNKAHQARLGFER